MLTALSWLFWLILAPLAAMLLAVALWLLKGLFWLCVAAFNVTWRGLTHHSTPHSTPTATAPDDIQNTLPKPTQTPESVNHSAPTPEPHSLFDNFHLAGARGTPDMKAILAYYDDPRNLAYGHLFRTPSPTPIPTRQIDEQIDYEVVQEPNKVTHRQGVRRRIIE